ncbi:Not1 N-terminal domain, CCR4-Not complex component-domain-containing protein [Mycena amicta]|nr:Not1 N-terminal domain, CCR4-Not complex component-domain-containing protein [Mycena amicta]
MEHGGRLCENSRVTRVTYCILPLSSSRTMAARKLQTEIDQALKKVAEGVELFETTYDKMQASNNQAQKEKLEAALKIQIKKLQRLRDQIRAWVASNDIKDKTQLLDNRRLIETQMEKFKACEKEVKKKAFSNVALGEAVKLDPKEQEMIEAVAWLDNQLEKLQMQVEAAEAEVESIQGAQKKKAKSGSATATRLDDLEHLNSRRKWHISRLEIVLRMLNNGTLDPEQVMALKEDVHYFVETNMEEDFTEYEGIYDELNLDEEEEKFRGALDDAMNDSDDESELVDEPSSSSSRPQAKKASEDSSSKRAESPILKKSAALPRKQSDAKPPPVFAAQPMSSLLKPVAPRPPPVTLPIRGYSAAVQHQPPAPPKPPQASTQKAAALPPLPQTATTADTPSSPSLTHPSAASPMSSYASVSVSHGERESSFYESPALSEALAVGSGPVAMSSPKGSIASLPRVPSPLSASEPLVEPISRHPSEESDAPQEVDIPRFPPGVAVGPGTSEPQPLPLSTSSSSQAIGSHRQPQPQPQAPPPQQANGHTPAVTSVPMTTTITSNVQPSSFPPGLADLVLPFERAKQRASQRMQDVDTLNKYLENGLSTMPQPQDTLKPKYYMPRNPFATASYYPQAPLALLNNKALYSQIDVETLFYIFYFVPVSYPKYLAAEELKRQSWRFHVKYLTWFQRHSEPQAITEEYEQGVYVYFDWEGSWCQRKKSDFRFEYRYLAED